MSIALTTSVALGKPLNNMLNERANAKAEVNKKWLQLGSVDLA